MKSKILTLFAAILLTACASTESSLDEKNQQIQQYVQNNNIGSVDKITSFRFHGWSSLTNDFLIISSSPKKQYLLKLTGYCNDIRWAHAIILNRTTSSTLHAKFDSVAPAGAPQSNCRINSIYPITGEQEDAIKAIKNPPEEEETEEQA